MKLLKKENGHTLIELVLVMALIGIVLVVLSSSMLSVSRTYVRADKKAENLEELRLIINHLTDNFQSYDRCEVWAVDDLGADEILNKKPVQPDPPVDPPVTGPTFDNNADSDGFITVKEVKFIDEAQPGPPVVPASSLSMKYEELVAPAPGVHSEGKLNWVRKSSVEISEISSFKVRLVDDLLEFKIGVIKKGHGVVADQTLEAGTTLDLKYKLEN